MSDIPPRQLFPNEGPSHQLNAPPLVGSVEFIQHDVVCSQCGYNLRGQPRDGRCSECGTAVMDAFRRGMLIYADRDWLIRVRSGVVLAFWGLVVSIFLSCAGVVAVFSSFSNFTPGTPPQLPSWINIPSVILGFVGIVFGLIVVYRLTAPEPQAGDLAPPKRSGRTRMIVRLAWLALAFQIINAPVFLILSPDPSLAPQPMAWIVYTVLVGSLSSIIYLVGFVLLLLHLRSIARRDRTPALGKLFTFVAWGGVCSLTAVMAGGFAMILLSGGLAQGAAYQSTFTTTQIAGATVTVTGPMTTTAPVLAVTPTTAPFASHAAPSPALFLFLPVLAVSECFGFVVFILGIVAAVQFYRALSGAITHNVGMAQVFEVRPPATDSKLSG